MQNWNLPQAKSFIPPGSHWIGGELVKGEGEAKDNLYPATNETLNTFHYATTAEIELAVSAAQHGYEVWRNTPPAERARILFKAAQILRRRNDEFAQVECIDTGKAIQETLVVDAVSAADSMEYFSAQAATLTGEHVAFSGSQGDWGYTVREPLGICVGITAWNYPLQMAGWKSAPALACGNAIIVKPSELTPLTALMLAEVYQEAGLPDGVYNVVQGDGTVGAQLVSHPSVAKISMTGETTTGSKVLKGAADDIKKVTLELGGKSPLLIFDDADLDAAVAGAMLANFYSTGQVCSNGTRVFVHESIRESFLEKLIEVTKRIKIGDPLDAETNMGPLVSTPHLAKVRSYFDSADDQGECLYKAELNVPENLVSGNWIAPAIYAPHDHDQPIAKEEIFGPFLSLFSFKDEHEAVGLANDTPFGLAAGLFTKDLARAHRVISNLDAGSCWINTFNITPVEIPFGGHKKSGLGMENGRWALEAYSQIKSVYVAMEPLESPY